MALTMSEALVQHNQTYLIMQHPYHKQHEAFTFSMETSFQSLVTSVTKNHYIKRVTSFKFCNSGPYYINLMLEDSQRLFCMSGFQTWLFFNRKLLRYKNNCSTKPVHR